MNNIEDDQDILGQLEQELPDETHVHQGDDTHLISKQLQKAQQTLRECQQNSKTLRTSHLRSHAAEEAEKGDTATEKMLKRILRSETMSRMCSTL